jgi:acid stress-induced BolA-like protein IbaG/YrbA
MEVDEIRSLIEAGLPGTEAEVRSDDGTHFSAVVVSAEFIGKTMVQQHQLVYKTLGSRIGNEIHALAIKTYTPEQWAKEKELKAV